MTRVIASKNRHTSRHCSPEANQLPSGIAHAVSREATTYVSLGRESQVSINGIAPSRGATAWTTISHSCRRFATLSSLGNRFLGLASQANAWHCSAVPKLDTAKLVQACNIRGKSPARLCSFALCLLICLLIGTSVSQAQFRLNIHEVAETTFAAPSPTTTAKEVADQQRQRMVQLGRNAALARNIQNLVSNRFGSTAAAQQHFEKELEDWISRLDGNHKLTLSQRSKLWLAGSRDIESFFREADELANSQFGDMREMVAQVRDLQNRLQNGICSEGSSLSKVAKRVMAETDAVRSHTTAADREEFLKAAALRTAVAEIDHLVPMTASQRAKLLEFLMQKQRPRRSGYSVLAAISEISRHRHQLDSILSDQQLGVLPAAITTTTAKFTKRFTVDPVPMQ